jgi:hypothetical protein
VIAAYTHFWMDATGSIVATLDDQPPADGMDWQPLRGR